MTLLPAWTLVGVMTLAGAQTPQTPQTQPQQTQRTRTTQQSQQDEYTRIELMPEIGSLTMTRDVAVTTPGATEWTMPLRNSVATNVTAVTDMMTGQPLKFTQTREELHVTLARPIAGGAAGQARLQVTATAKESQGYFRVNDGPRDARPEAAAAHRARAQAAQADEVMFVAAVPGMRSSIALPAGYRVMSCNVPSQVLPLPDGRTQISFMWQYPGPEMTSLQIRLKADAQTGDAAKPRPLTNARSWEPPPTQGPTERARLSERAAQDRDIVYFLLQPKTNTFRLYHDYTESREGMDKYLNVVRTGSTVSAPSGVVLDTGTPMKVEVLKGAQLAAAGIETDGAQVAADQEVVVFRYPAVKAGQSLRLRLFESYTAPASYRLEGDDLVFERSLGRPRNSVILPDGWYVTALSIPGVIRQTESGETRIDFVNPRPDAIDVLLKGRSVVKPVKPTTPAK